ncbi:hypothetical protein NG895_29305 [Aeoliella sp. ICT_H6.2]|uniref:Cbb3-type cytochrome oxidase component FixQ n=1 Tax=Aeoliella straminimaris TaxID=2954799 RepID=A0A9X2FF98_9BACT|nr:hypothetical protein [Aeoliella straminimaris]MCO6048020.1 hypothetical protein [Aeoliella straminimaris]
MEWLQNDASIQLLKNIALVLFFSVFTGVIVWLLFRKNSDIRRWSRLPLDDEPKQDDSPSKDDSSS